MKTIVLILILSPFYCFCQHHYDLCDKNEPLENNWEEKKDIFLPKDLHKFPLLFEILDESEIKEREKKATSDYNSSNIWVLENGFFGLNQKASIKRFKKFYTREYKLVYTDSIKNYNQDEYPYVLRLYSEPLQLENKTQNWSYRVGYVIYDRRTNKAYSMIVGRTVKRESWLFSNL